LSLDLAREVRIHKRLRELLLLFSRGVASSFSLREALEPVIPGIREALEASSVEIWLHDRRTRVLTLAASAGGGPPGQVVPVEDTSHYAAEGLRLERPAVIGVRVVAPLRGWRRALGTLSIERDGAIDDHAFLEFAHELARQLSVGVENVRLLEDVLRQRRLLEDTFNSLTDLVAVVDRDLKLVQTNQAFAARVGLAPHDVLGRPLQELVGMETFAYVETPDPGDANAPAQHRVEDAALKGTFLLTATPLSTHDGRTVGRVLVARDITRQTRLEAERAALRERLAQSEKLASLGQFVAGIAHEMNNPLQGVLGHLELLIDMTDAARPVRRELKQIYQEADRAAKIVHNLLVFTGSHRLQRQRVPLDRILTRALASRSAHVRKTGITIARTKGSGVPPVMVDPLLLQQALLNILINAEHAALESPQPRIEVETAVGSDGQVILTIHDSGRGIADEVLPRIFDPFFTTKDVGQGTGLGLAITYGIIKEHGGTIAASTAAEGGAVFRIELPGSGSGDRVTQGPPGHDR
jgi:two-component system, NtrC family, sensor kinase